MLELETGRNLTQIYKEDVRKKNKKSLLKTMMRRRIVSSIHIQF